MYPCAVLHRVQYLCQWNVYGAVQRDDFRSPGLFELLCVYADYHVGASRSAGGQWDLACHACRGTDGAVPVRIYVYEISETVSILRNFTEVRT